MRKSLLRLLLCLSVLVLVCLFLACLGISYPLEMFFNFVAGWVVYCSRVLPLVRPSPAGILTALVCMGGLIGGLHLFLRWLSRQLQASRQIKEQEIQTWPARRTALT